jgi:DeoR/GlpR family transcriptional regulator of sugar metabolism
MRSPKRAAAEASESRTLTAERKAQAEKRRAYIVKVLIDDHESELTFDAVIEECGQVSDQTLYNDAAYLQDRDQPISASKRRFILDSGGLSTIRRRTQEQKREKEQIGQIAEQIVMPELPKDPARLMRKGSRLQLDIGLRTRLVEFWNKAHRLLILDSGSTTASIARHLATVKPPDPKRLLADLRVLTNGGLIFQTFNQPDCSHGLILLGGAVRRDTDAVAGTLAELCLEKWALKADIAIIGTTNINDSFKFCCDHEDEASIKSRLLAAARIRCIAADSTKLVNPGRGSTWEFTGLHRSMIDIIITDPRIWEQDSDARCEQRRLGFLQRVREEKILLASEPG